MPASLALVLPCSNRIEIVRATNYCRFSKPTVAASRVTWWLTSLFAFKMHSQVIRNRMDWYRYIALNTDWRVLPDGLQISISWIWISEKLNSLRIEVSTVVWALCCLTRVLQKVLGLEGLVVYWSSTSSTTEKSRLQLASVKCMCNKLCRGTKALRFFVASMRCGWHFYALHTAFAMRSWEVIASCDLIVFVHL